MITSPAKFLTGFAVVAGVAVVVAIALSLGRPAPAPPPLPRPNGYDDFVKAGQTLTGDVSDWPKLSKEELQAALAADVEALKLARIGLGRECRVPLNYSPTTSAQLENLAVFKRLAQGFAAEARLAELENRLGDAVGSCLDAVRLGRHSVRGGLIINSLVGIAIEAYGLGGLEKLVPRLDAKQCREAASALETLESQRESPESVLAQEHEWGRRTFGFQGQIARLVTYKSLKQNEQRWAGKVKAHQARSQRLLIELAARAYELEKGDRPRNLGNLVPAYLKSIPQDPLTGTNMAYLP